MALITYFTDGKQAVTRLGTQVVTAQEVIDFTKATVASGNTVNLLKIPAKAIVHNVSVIVETAEGASCTMEVGDGSDADYFIDSVELNTTGANLQTAASPAGVAGGKYYSAAGYIVGTVGTSDANVAKCRVIATYSVVESNTGV